MADADCTACGHDRYKHRPYSTRKRCEVWVGGRLDGNGFMTGGKPCDCTGYTVAVLPAEGERLTFGQHRQEEPDAETAPAWGTSAGLRRQLDREADRRADAALRSRRRAGAV